MSLDLRTELLCHGLLAYVGAYADALAVPLTHREVETALRWAWLAWRAAARPGALFEDPLVLEDAADAP